MTPKHCRFCNTPLHITFANLGLSPIANNYLDSQDLNKYQKFYPLHSYVCEKCFLVQLEEFETPEHIFSEYAYFSSYSEGWLTHAKQYTQKVIDLFSLDHTKKVVEVASNDGYLLQYFAAQGITTLGIEPAVNVAEVAKNKGISVRTEFFCEKLATQLVSEGMQADLLIGNNVLAHVPDINDFVGSLKILLKSDGVITIEFPHLLNLIEKSQFDTIYHEHFSYLSFGTVNKIFNTHALRLFDVEELPTHGGSLRIYACHKEFFGHTETTQVKLMLEKEKKAGLQDISGYLTFAEKIQTVKYNLLEKLIALKKQGKTIAGYGAPAKGNTFLNYCGIRSDIIEYTVDRSFYKQGKYLPGTQIPIFAPEKIMETKPEYVLILPWNLKNEIIEQMQDIRQWDGKFIVAIPSVEVI